MIYFKKHTQRMVVYAFLRGCNKLFAYINCTCYNRYRLYGIVCIYGEIVRIFHFFLIDL